VNNEKIEYEVEVELEVELEAELEDVEKKKTQKLQHAEKKKI